jgi:hypothetical protein
MPVAQRFSAVTLGLFLMGCSAAGAEDLMATQSTQMWRKPRYETHCAEYVPGCTVPDYVQGCWADLLPGGKKPWWAEEIPGLVDVTKLDNNQRKELLEVKEVRDMQTFRDSQHCLWSGNKWLGYRLEIPREVQGCDSESDAAPPPKVVEREVYVLVPAPAPLPTPVQPAIINAEPVPRHCRSWCEGTYPAVPQCYQECN